jgi:hypothetical protein
VLALLAVKMIISHLDEKNRHEERSARAAEDPSAAELGRAVARQATSMGLNAAAQALGMPTTELGPPPSATVIAATVTPSARAPRARHYSGAKAFLSSTNFTDCKGCGWDAYKEAMHAQEAAISACFAASQLDPPRHESVYYDVGVSPTGALTTLEPTTFAMPRLDACLRKIVFAIPLANPSGNAGSFKIGFFGECAGKFAPPTMQWCDD